MRFSRRNSSYAPRLFRFKGMLFVISSLLCFLLQLHRIFVVPIVPLPPVVDQISPPEFVPTFSLSRKNLWERFSTFPTPTRSLFTHFLFFLRFFTSRYTKFSPPSVILIRGPFFPSKVDFSNHPRNPPFFSLDYCAAPHSLCILLFFSSRSDMSTNTDTHYSSYQGPSPSIL